MYHFVSEQIPELRLSDNVLIPNRTTQFLKCFQLEAVRFMYERISKKEFCILNDESGLGKCASVVALLSGLGTTKKTLIVLQNDDQLLVGWQFHLSVLTDLAVCVIKDVNDTTASAHSVYLSKWSILRSIGDLSKLKFDYIIVDHRGYTLNNNFCTSMLIKQFERKVNIVISSVDVTSDVKLLYNVLHLGGCLEQEYKSFKLFQRKFHLPDVKEVLSKRVDLEDYYKQRGALGEYIKDFRLRRYRHQFDSYLPLVTSEQYKRNLSLWLGENNSNSTLSGFTVDSKTSGGSSTEVTDDIYECLISLKQERQAIARQMTDKMSVLEHSDDVVAMEPLLFESESDHELPAEPDASNNNVILLSSDDCEIVVPTDVNTPTTTRTKRKYGKRKSVARANDLTDSETEELPPQFSKTIKKLNVRLTRISLPDQNREATINKTSNQQTDKRENALQCDVALEPSSTMEAAQPEQKMTKAKSLTTPKSEPRSKRSNGSKYSATEPRQTRGMQRLTRSADSRSRNRYMTQLRALGDVKKATPRKKNNQGSNQTPKTSSGKRDKQDVREGGVNSPKTSKNPKSTTERKPEPKRRRGRSPKQIAAKKSNKPNEKRSAKSEAAGLVAVPESSNRRRIEVSPKTTKTSASSTVEPSTTPLKNCRNGALVPPVPTPDLLSSCSVQSDNSYMQCAQKLPENLSELEVLDFPRFRVPDVPRATPLMFPLSMNLLNDTEVAFVPMSPSQQPDVVMVNSSHDESSPPASQSRRTRALKRKRSGPSTRQPAQQTSNSNFGLLLAQQRSVANKSPDIFSNCSDSQVTLAQHVPFEGFKIFGSEVKQPEQPVKAQTTAPNKKSRERSCLDLLEQIFEPQQAKNNDDSVQRLLNLLNSKEHLPPRRFTLLDDDIFEITNNGEFGSRLRINSTGNVSPVHQPQGQSQRNKITNYLIGSIGPTDDTSQRTQSSQLLRKSPKATKSTQSTKLTRWFGSTSANSGESRSAPSTPVVPAEKAEQARSARSAGSKKRKRLKLDK